MINREYEKQESNYTPQCPVSLDAKELHLSIQPIDSSVKVKQ